MRSAANLPWLPILFDYLSVMMKDMLSLVVREPFPIGPLSLMHHLIVLVFFYQLWAYRIRRNPANQLGYDLLLAGAPLEKLMPSMLS